MIVDPIHDEADDHANGDDSFNHEDPYAVHESEEQSLQSIETLADNLEYNLDGGRKRLGSEGDEMSFLEHLEDLRGTLFKSLMAFLIMEFG